MNKILSRFRELPAPLLDGRWTHCALTVADGRIRFREPLPLSAHRRRMRLRRRALLGLGGGLALAAMGLVHGEAQLALGIVGSVLWLAMLDGLHTDVTDLGRPFEYAVIDAVRGEVDLRAPGGWLLTARLTEITVFLMVADVRHRRCHVGVVMHDGHYLPWLTTAAPQAAMALTWLFGHLTEVPSLRVVGALPLACDWMLTAEPIPSPVGEPPA